MPHDHPMRMTCPGCGADVKVLIRSSFLTVIATHDVKGDPGELCMTREIRP